MIRSFCFRGFCSPFGVRFLLLTMPLLCCTAQVVSAQNALNNLNFEDGVKDEAPSGWSVFLWPREAGYIAALTDKNPQEGRLCVRVHRPEQATGQWGALGKRIDASNYRGKRVRLRAAVRAEVDPEVGTARLWLRVDRPAGQPGFLDNMEDRPIISDQWQYYEITTEVAEDATLIAFGTMILGRGMSWSDDVSLEIIGPDGQPFADDPVETQYGFEWITTYDGLSDNI